MLNIVKMQNFGPIQQLNWRNLAKINLIIGNNGSGKTFILKALYSTLRTLEEYKRGDDPRTASDILVEKLYWTFQPEKIGDLMSKGAESPLAFSVSLGDRVFNYSFGRETTKSISTLENHIVPGISNSIFLPAKEVLSLHQIILKSREQDHVFGFDDTYLDLARILRQAPRKGRNYPEFSQSRKTLEQLCDGKVEFDEASNRWYFKKGNQKFPIGIMAEGIKKIAILDILLGNRFLSKDSVIFIDEPESALHPSAISKLLDIIGDLAEVGIQFILASHSYFVIKKLMLIAQERNLSIPVMSAVDQTWEFADLKDGMPDNPIIQESIDLYKKEIALVLE